MNGPRVSPTRGLTAIDGAMALIVLLLVVQMWLLSATLDAYLAGHGDAALPGAVISGVLFLACGGLCLFVIRLEKLRRVGGAVDSGSSP
ncbi:MAG: hypothetical protein LAP61_03820 [Acidobacteriia bacterium]|nr:hypothetical protein [Terriglobia bacterium]